MLFITDLDFDVQVKEEIKSLLGDGGTYDRAERMAIDQVKNRIGGRYDAATIFAATGDLRDHYLVMIVIDMMMYHLWSKKAPRMIPEYRSTRYADALEWLADIGNGKTPSALPQLPSADYSNEIRISSVQKLNNHKF